MPRPDNPGYYTNGEAQLAARFINELIKEYSMLKSESCRGRWSCIIDWSLHSESGIWCRGCSQAGQDGVEACIYSISFMLK